MFGFFKDNTIDQIYTFETLQKFAFSLIGIFIPIYIASEGYPLSWVLGFILILVLTFTIISVPISYIISKTGFKHSLILSYFFYLPAFILLKILEISIELLVTVAVLMAFGKALHWLSLHSEFAIDTEESTRDKAAGRLLGLPGLSKAVAPALGGIIMIRWGFDVLVTLTILITLISIIPLFASKDHRDPMGYRFASMINKKHVTFASLFILRGFLIAAGYYIFPLYVYYLVGGTINSGGVLSMAGFGSVVFALLIGRVTGKVERKHMVMIGSISSCILFVLRTYVGDPFEAFLISFLAGLMVMVYYIPLYSKIAEWAKDEDVLEFYAFREVFIGIGKVSIVLSSMIFAFYYSMSIGFKMTFYIASIAALLIAFYSKWIERTD
ncbi:MAG: MFS transporter [Candidatus Aenigmatarchaeota archaeon]